MRRDDWPPILIRIGMSFLEVVFASNDIGLVISRLGISSGFHPA